LLAFLFAKSEKGTKTAFAAALLRRYAFTGKLKQKNTFFVISLLFFNAFRLIILFAYKAKGCLLFTGVSRNGINLAGGLPVR